MKKLSLLLLIALIAFAGCNNEKKGDEAGELPDAKMKEHEGVMVTSEWVRPGAIGMNTAVFMNIMNHTDEDDMLYKAECDAAETVEIHESYEAEDGKMGMREVEGITVGSKNTAELKPRGYHIMLIGLKEDLQKGDKTMVTLYFKKAGKVEVEAEVNDVIPAEAEHH